jgi:quercetin dioxygenase-like cupin family protein
MRGTEVAPAAGVVCVADGQGPALWSMGSLMEGKLAGAGSAGTLEVSVITQPPGLATPLHVHRREAEAFFVLEGSMAYEAGGELFHLEPGSFIYLPPDVPHRFRVTGDRPSRFLGIVTPAGLSGLYREIGVPAQGRHLPVAPPSPEDVARWLAAAPGYGIEVLGPPLPNDA